jgi:PAS domain S-box-containing protein
MCWFPEGTEVVAPGRWLIAADQEQQSRLIAMALSSVSEWAYVLDRDGRFRYANASLLNVLGLGSDQILGKNFFDLNFPDKLARRLDRQIRQVVASGERVTGETAFVSAAGKSAYYEYVYSPMFAPDGSVEAVAGTGRDITEQNRQKVEVGERLLDAERSLSAKSEFMAVVAHELRTPLSAILIWARLLRDESVEQEKGQALEAIEQSAIAQKRMIEDLMDMSRMLSGSLRLNRSRADLVPVGRKAVEALRPMAEAKGVNIDFSVAVGSAIVLADRERFQQVVWNLLTNAIKFSRNEGLISVGFRIVGDNFQFRVADTGMGIGADFLPHVFDRFRQGATSAKGRQGGLGLGLAITRELVELHGGTIKAGSEGKGLGARFTVEVPLAAGQAEEDVAASSPGSVTPILSGVSVLLVEDERHTREAVRLTLERSKASVTAVATASQALSALRTVKDEQRYDVLVIDVGLPDQDGYELLRAVRQWEAGAIHPMPAIALTAYAGQADKQNAKAAGFQIHIAKPVNAGDLLTTLAQLTGRGESVS